MNRIPLLLLALLIPQLLEAQAQRREPLVLDGLFVRETIPQRIPVPYPHLREADVMWSKRIWRVIDLRQRINFPLYYPTVRMHDRVSLVQRLVDAVKFNEINAYDPVDDEFTTLLSYDQLLVRFDAQDQVRQDISPITGRDTTIVTPGQFRWHEVLELLVKEEWFFDRKHSRMQVRIIGICPIRVFPRRIPGQEEEEGVEPELVRKQLFWVYFPHARTVLANTAVFNENNDAQRISFDDLFFQRRFSSYIVAETNVHNNRLVSEYTFGGIPNMLESDRIRMEIFELEHDLWEY